MSREHYSEPQLLALLDGEQPVWRAAFMRCHLRVCWTCRSRLEEIGAGVSQVSGLFAGGAWLPPGVAVRNRELLLERMASSRTLQPARTGTRRHLFWGVACASAAIFLCVTFLRPAPAGVEHSLARAEGLESAALTTDAVSDQTAAVELVQAKPAPSRLERRLELLVDARERRSRLYWSDDAGRIQRAVWRPDPAHVYASDAGEAPKPVTDMTEAPGPGAWNADNLRSLERACVRWLESQDWKPLRLSAHFREFSAAPNSHLSIATTARGIELHAARTEPGRRIEMLLVLGPDGHPVREMVTMTLGDREFSVSLTPIRRRLVERASLKRTDFDPPAAVRDPTIVPDPRLPGSPAVEPLAVKAQPLLDTYWRLHESGACTRDVLEIAASPGGVWVTGVVADDARREELQTTLSGIAGVTAELRSGAGGTPLPTAVTIYRAPATPSEDRLPVEDILAAYRERSGASETSRQFSNRMLQASERAARHASALRRLHAAFPGAVIQELSTVDRDRLRQMSKSHVEGAGHEISLLLVSLEPVLGQTGAQPLRPSRQPGIERVLSLLEQEHLTIYRLFTVSAAAPVSIEENTRDLMESLREADSLIRLTQQ